MFKKNVFKILAIVFFVLSGITFLYSNKTPNKKSLDTHQKKQFVKKTISPALAQKDKISPAILGANNFYISPINKPTQIIIQPTNSPTPYKGSVTPDPYINSATLSVYLSIAGSSIGKIEIPQNSNQCDLLTQALSQGKIQSLNMRYNNDMGTNAVYQINGVGKENTVWWGYKVNGQSPSQGCSFIKVNDGDNVLWEYVGN